MLLRSLILAVIACAGVGSAPARAASSVTIFGDLQSELGCPGDYQPGCTATHLTFDAADGIWQGSFMVPAGTWSYQAALDDTFGELYGAHATKSGAALSFTLGSTTAVKFFYDPVSHWITSSANSAIATAAGDFQSELGCPGDWQPDCLRSLLEDIEGDGIYDFATSAIPPGNYEWKVAIDQSWAESYGAGGVGAQLPFTVASGDRVAFSWNSSTHAPRVTVIPPTPAATPTPTPAPTPTPEPTASATPAPTPTPVAIPVDQPKEQGGPLATGFAATIATKTTADLLRHGLAVRFTAANPGAITWRLRDAVRSTVVARGQLSVKAGTSIKALKLTTGGKRRVRAGHLTRFKLELSWVDSQGGAARLDLKSTLKAK